ncbi:Uncharacterised protein [Candidatus Tiddalikarchaeum anstoanum]|nr:Uncharacterised protein [Candidatus Tiddalikarchaeum anstoanum]
MDAVKPTVGKLKFEYDSVLKLSKSFDKVFSSKRNNLEREIVRLFSSMVESVETGENKMSDICYFIANFVSFDFPNDQLHDIVLLAGELEIPKLSRNASSKWEELKNRLKQLKKDLDSNITRRN